MTADDGNDENDDNLEPFNYQELNNTSTSDEESHEESGSPETSSSQKNNNSKYPKDGLFNKDFGPNPTSWRIKNKTTTDETYLQKTTDNPNSLNGRKSKNKTDKVKYIRKKDRPKLTGWRGFNPFTRILVVLFFVASITTGVIYYHRDWVLKNRSTGFIAKRIAYGELPIDLSSRYTEIGRASCRERV